MRGKKDGSAGTLGNPSEHPTTGHYHPMSPPVERHSEEDRERPRVARLWATEHLLCSTKGRMCKAICRGRVASLPQNDNECTHHCVQECSDQTSDVI